MEYVVTLIALAALAYVIWRAVKPYGELGGGGVKADPRDNDAV